MMQNARRRSLTRLVEFGAAAGIFFVWTAYSESGAGEGCTLVVRGAALPEPAAAAAATAAAVKKSLR